MSLIEEVESCFTEGDFSPTKYATCIGRVRVLLAESFKMMANSLSERRRDRRISVSTNEHAAFDYLRSIKFLNDYEWNVLRSLYDLASDQGSHKAMAFREYARIAKNMTYEIILLALTRDENFK